MSEVRDAEGKPPTLQGGRYAGTSELDPGLKGLCLCGATVGQGLMTRKFVSPVGLVIALAVLVGASATALGEEFYKGKLWVPSLKLGGALR